ncbi:hypothetical protein [Quadrisphaera sp. KR29]|uniref:hypothetical protein n=1 Tax=Quadrisphaera sp. KR29 TaxID=3461391 RepID=UPI0040446A16
MTSSAPPEWAVGDDADLPAGWDGDWHTAKTHGGWDLVQSSPGSFTWTSPTGRVYQRTATPVLPDLVHVLPG